MQAPVAGVYAQRRNYFGILRLARGRSLSALLLTLPSRRPIQKLSFDVLGAQLTQEGFLCQSLTPTAELV